MRTPSLALLDQHHRESVLENAFRATRQLARTADPPWRQQIIEHGGQAVGWVATAQQDDGAIELIRLDVLPGRQGVGIGTAVLAALLAEADAQARTVRTFAHRTNRAALDWYVRLGFTEVGGDAVVSRLERAPRAACGTS